MWSGVSGVTQILGDVRGIETYRSGSASASRSGSGSGSGSGSLDRFSKWCKGIYDNDVGGNKTDVEGNME